ncbi:hypothetical protein TL16_g10110 [Triparma laevis f. inornata]|uniref:Uncharacterized protein n=1 Tax=Triparma laevis f. inornata TaxID=1714386 RepID=A0A9W7EMX2_9STRA|nr:hypothetical protein TL16_g10110 [Triparma laevis f. inornata]
MHPPTLKRENKLHRTRVNAVTRAEHVVSSSQDVGCGAYGAFLFFVDAEDGADGDVAVDVGGTVEGVEGDAVLRDECEGRA